MLPCGSLSLSCRRGGEEEEAKDAYSPRGLGRIHPVATLPLVPVLSTRPYICRENGVPQKMLWILCTIVLIRGAAGGQPAPCY